MYTIGTLHDLRARLGLATADTADDARLIGALGAATAAIERRLGRRFIPQRATLAHPIHKRDRSLLLLERDLLTLLTLEDASGTIPASDYALLPADPPHSAIELLNGRTFIWDDAPYRAVSITGIWGWHEDWANAFRSSGDTVQNNPLSASATSLTVTDADGADSAHVSPRFQVGHLLKIGDEYLRVLAVNTTTNILTVARGVGGTTAVSHAQTTAISTFQPPEDVRQLCVRWAAWLYREADAVQSGDLPAHLLRGLALLRREGVR